MFACLRWGWIFNADRAWTGTHRNACLRRQWRRSYRHMTYYRACLMFRKASANVIRSAAAEHLYHFSPLSRYWCLLRKLLFFLFLFRMNELFVFFFFFSSMHLIGNNWWTGSFSFELENVNLSRKKEGKKEGERERERNQKREKNLSLCSACVLSSSFEFMAAVRRSVRSWTLVMRCRNSPVLISYLNRQALNSCQLMPTAIAPLCVCAVNSDSSEETSSL